MCYYGGKKEKIESKCILAAATCGKKDFIHTELTGNMKVNGRNYV